MKKILLLILCLSVIGNIFCQSDRKNYIGINYSFGSIDYKSNRTGFFSSSNYEGKSYRSIGFDYRYRISENVDFCTGLIYTNNILTLRTRQHFSDGRSNHYYDDNLFIFSLPLRLKYHFLKYLFIDGGASVNYHPSKGYKWGVGFGVGLGAEYIFNNGFVVSFAPNIKLNFLDEEESDNRIHTNIMPDKLTQWGIKFGLGYIF